jgi:ATP-dependent DNA helicase RecQ
MDARLVFQVLRNQLTALTQQNADQPDAVAAFHFLTTRMENPGGFDAVFQEVRGAPAPDPSAAGQAISRLLAGRACEAGRADAEPPSEPAARMADGLCVVMDSRRGR